MQGLEARADEESTGVTKRGGLALVLDTGKSGYGQRQVVCVR